MKYLFAELETQESEMKKYLMEADEAFDQEDYSLAEQLEIKADLEYRKCLEMYDKISGKIELATGGRLEKYTARRMLINQREALVRILERR